MLVTKTTLCLLIKDDRILLPIKKRGFGKGKNNGVGGKLESGETELEAMIRETKEEINVIPTKYEKVGEIFFDEYYKDEKEKLIFYLYIVTDYEGVISETDEMKPMWFNINNIPYDTMFPDDAYWMPYILDGKKIKVYFKFDKDWNILEKEIKEVDKF